MSIKQKLYDNYVSTGQAKDNSILNSKQPFQSNKPYVKKLINRFIPNKNARVVDLACGSGMYLYILKELGYTNTVGCDISQEQIEIAHKLGITNAKHMDLVDLLLNERSIDCVLFIDILEHLEASEVFSILEQVHSKLTDGGRVIIHVPNAEGIFGMKIRYGDYTHEQAFTNTSLRQILMATGFQSPMFYEDKPVVHSFTSFIRLALWELLTIPFRLLALAESADRNAILSKNILVVAEK